MNEYKIIISINLGDDASLQRVVDYLMKSITRTIVTQNWNSTKYNIECLRKLAGNTSTFIPAFGNHEAGDR